MKNQTITRILGISVMICASGVFAGSASAATVVNNFTATANSGGNSAGSGEIVEGKSQNSISIYTEVNGEVVEDYAATSSAPLIYSTTQTTANATVAQNAAAGMRTEATTSSSILQSLRDSTEESAAEIEAELEEAAENLGVSFEGSASTSVEVETVSVATSGSSVSWFVSLQAAVKNFFAYVLAWF